MTPFRYCSGALFLQFTFCLAKHHRGNWLATPQHRPWGRLNNYSKLSLPPTSHSLRPCCLQVRGGSGYGESGGYYGDDNDNDNYRNDHTDRGKNNYPYEDYDDRRGSPSRSSGSNAVQSSFSSLQAKFKNGDRRLGVPLLGLGVVFTVMGVSLFFNKSLMRLGNLMFIAGIPTTIGPSRTAGYFFRPEKTRATACLCLGIFLVFVGWPIFGMALEIFGILNLFGNMFPMFWVIFKNLPIVSSITKSSGSGRRPTYSYNRERERDYRDDPYADDRQDYGDYRDEDAESYY